MSLTVIEGHPCRLAIWTIGLNTRRLDALPELWITDVAEELGRVCCPGVGESKADQADSLGKDGTLRLQFVVYQLIHR